MRHRRNIGTGGERLFDSPFLAPGLAEAKLQPWPDFRGSGNPIDCALAPRVQKLDLYPALSHLGFAESQPYRKLQLRETVPTTSASCASRFSAALVFRVSLLPLGASRPTRAPQSFRAPRTTGRRVGGFPPRRWLQTSVSVGEAPAISASLPRDSLLNRTCLSSVLVCG